VIDPLGNVPIFMSILRTVESPARRRIIVIRECSIALGILLISLWFGQPVIHYLGLSQPSIGIAGGIVLFLISLRMIFDHADQVFGGSPSGEPFIVPLAVPFLAGPSAFATLLLLAGQSQPMPGRAALALVCAMAITTAVLLSGSRLIKWIGERGLDAFQRLMGLVLTAMAVEMFLRGLRQFINS
jgi:MarC family membrane protein